MAGPGGGSGNACGDAGAASRKGTRETSGIARCRVKVVILCGGQGTRIRGVNDDLPKPMIPIGRYPILWHIMRGYAAAGFKDFVLCLGYRGRVIKDFFLNYDTSV